MNCLGAAAPRQRPFRARGPWSFTLVELLVVVATIGVLAAILVPVVAGARVAARRAEVRTQFAQWSVAIEGFRAEYGHYPNFSATTTAPLPAFARVNELPGLFYQTLTGRREWGGVPDLARARLANPRRIGFLTFAAGELGAAAAGEYPAICDAFGNTDIVILVDRDGDGIIDAPQPLPAVTGGMTGLSLTLPAVAFPAGGVRAGVLIYSAGAGRTADDILCSWR